MIIFTYIKKIIHVIYLFFILIDVLFSEGKNILNSFNLILIFKIFNNMEIIEINGWLNF